MNKVYVASEGVRNCVERVAKVEGKGLSTNDFTNEYLNKVNSILNDRWSNYKQHSQRNITIRWWGNSSGYV